ncbi:MAG: D-alanine--D-alanine ligase [Actinomycetota bacterium]|nr:D-alanine--D-alanine ligase [Actinomycetota bacterium]
MSEPSDTPIRLLVLFGGQSAEHEVSCTTAAHVLAAANNGHYEIVPIGITRGGSFVHAEDALAALAAGARSLPPMLTAAGPSADLLPVVHAVRPGQQVVVLPLLHGPLGEDGTVQGMLELAGVPYVGSGVLGSALAMDKAKAKEVLAAAGIPQTRWRTIFEPTFEGDLSAIVEDLGLPCFVKPANMGSSVGVSKATDEDELRSAIALAFGYDEWVVIEEAVVAREIEFAILGNVEVSVSLPGEVVPGADFYDYEDKYHDGNAQLIIPAMLEPEVSEQMTKLAIAAYRLLRCEGMARADFLYEEGGRGPLLNELNTIPGFTPISMYPKLWQASGVSYPKLIDELVQLAIERHQRRAAKRAR